MPRDYRERHTLTCALAWLSDRQYLPGSWGRPPALASFGSARQSAAAAAGMGALLPVWPRSRSAGERAGARQRCRSAGRDPLLWAAFVLVAATAAASSALLNAHAKRCRSRGSNLATIAAIAVPASAAAASLSCTPYGNCPPRLAAAVVAKAAICKPILSNTPTNQPKTTTPKHQQEDHWPASSVPPRAPFSL